MEKNRTSTHMYIYIYVCMYIYICVYIIHIYITRKNEKSMVQPTCWTLQHTQLFMQTYVEGYPRPKAIDFPTSTSRMRQWRDSHFLAGGDEYKATSNFQVQNDLLQEIGCIGC